MTIQEIRVPDIGDFNEVEIIEVLVSVGNIITAEDSLITVESDKASMEIPAPASGVVKEMKVAEGDKITEGSVILVLEAAAETDTEATNSESPADEKIVEATHAEKLTEPKEATQTATQPAPQPPPQVTSADKKPSHEAFKKAYATPSVRKFARELGADLSKVNGSGRKGRITQEDVKTYIKEMMSFGGNGQRGAPAVSGGMGIPPMPAIDFSQWGDVETLKLNRINKLTGEFLHRNWLHIPHVTQFDQADITEMEAFRKQLNEEYKKTGEGSKTTPLVFIMKALVAGLKKFPRFNTSLEPGGENLIQKHYFHIGIAVDTPDGLVVPVIRDVDKKSLSQLSEDLTLISTKARDKKLKPTDMQGGCISISSLGGIGGTKFTPIINAPDVAILGLSRSAMQPIWNGSEFEPRLMLPLSLSYDHRVIDGADAARFTTYISTLLSDIRRLLV
uniref:Acetyltransferase component of pyruvate dehydrogenase complex n=1 Tax=uncultured Thiotrichaceae bacterium TaxID=298394 RepID=A0A6S6U0Q1_9GAMM|nr:MAG: Dihydrolipoamide acetyltransferase component of pyruvate dehydrogenase complex (EC [uncultured Thiotrichaceae bacterium]